MKEYNFSGIMRATRKELGHSQKAMAELLRITQGTISKIENAILHPTAVQWIEFCMLVNLPMDSYKSNYVDKISLQNRELVSNTTTLLKLPKQYTSNVDTSIRYLIPIFELFIDKLGREHFNKYLNFLGVDPDYIVFREHKINLLFLLDILDYLVKNADLNSNDILDISGNMFNRNIHGVLFTIYDNSRSEIDRIEKFIFKANRYQTFSTLNIVSKNENEVEIVQRFSIYTSKLVESKPQEIINLANLYLSTFLVSIFADGKDCNLPESHVILSENGAKFNLVKKQ
jgi:transcriptional regulator with XRE-family HTH domain